MIITYKNTKEDIIEINKFTLKNRLIKDINFYVIYYAYICGTLISLYYLFNSIYIYITTNNIFYESLFFSLLIYLFINCSFGISLNISLDKLIKQKPQVLQNKTMLLNNNHLIISNKLNEKIEFSLNDILKIYTNEYNIYIFFKNYKTFEIIPNSAFKNEDEKSKFIEKLKQ